MARAIISGLLKADYPAQHICVSDPNAVKRDYFAARGIVSVENNEDAIRSADILVLAVKPQNMAELIDEIHSSVKKYKPVIVSLALGWTLGDLEARFFKGLAMVRAMPNMPAIVQSGAVGLYANDNLSSAQKNQVEHIFRSVGLTVWLSKEEHMNIVTALSGCGPAYFFYFMSALCDAAITLGLDEKTAHLLTIQTAFGAGKLALESQEPLDQLCSSVASKGGATEAALSVFAKEGLREMVHQAMRTAEERGDYLAMGWRQPGVLSEK